MEPQENPQIARYKVAIEAIKRQRNDAQDRVVDYETALDEANQVIGRLTRELAELQAKLPPAEEIVEEEKQ